MEENAPAEGLERKSMSSRQRLEQERDDEKQETGDSL